MKKIFTIIIFCFLAAFASGQEQLSEAQKKFLDGIKLVDEGNYEEGIKLFKEAQKLDPASSAPQYEIAQAYVRMKEYGTAIEILEKIKNKPDAEDIYYSCLGSCYDMDGDRDKAFEVYKAGLKKFPKSGRIYLELGVVKLDEKKYDKALKYFEKGIEVAPAHPSNYYWASILWADTKDRIWALIYGEIFLNLEKNSKRTENISKLMFDVYKDGFEFEDNAIKTHLSNTDDVQSSKIEADKLMNSFKVKGYEFPMALSAVGQNKIDLKSLNEIRTNYLDFYYKEGYDKIFPNIVFKYQKKVKDAGFLEAYNYWILYDGDRKDQTDWQNKNQETWNKFIKWFDKNPMTIDENNKFVRQ